MRPLPHLQILSTDTMSSSCTLVADRTDDAVQMLLGFIALSSLYAKWHFERPRRSAKVWFMDAMKQGTSAAMIHVMNILYAIGLVDFSDTPSDQDQVRQIPLRQIWTYRLTRLFVVAAVRLLLHERCDRHHARRVHCLFIAAIVNCHCGATAVDESAVSRLLRLAAIWRVWWMQLLQWCTILTVMKFFVGVVLYAFSTPLGWMGSLLFYPVHNHPKIELLIVMIGCPLVMNMVQFWIQDSFLMDHEQQGNEEVPLLDSSLDAVQKQRDVSNVSSAADMYEIL
ncbi:Store-operated calcium entry regulator STIMATE [Phytophthora cactorum]|nr:Store-operated calcium entry regulator STIMATE [Phytophthora cactorum]